MGAPARLDAALEGVEGWLSLEEAQLLHELAAAAGGGAIVEVGSYRGRSTVALSLGAAEGQGAPVYAIEPHEPFRGALGGEFGPEDRGHFFRNMLAAESYRNVRLVNLSSEVVTPGWKQPVALLWIDGDHRYEGVARDFSCWEPHLTDTARIAFDDSVDPGLGPYRLIGELLRGGRYRRLSGVGKVSVLARLAAGSSW